MDTNTDYTTKLIQKWLKSDLSKYYNTIVHFIGIILAAHMAAKLHPIYKNQDGFNMWWSLLLFNVVFVLTSTIDHFKVNNLKELEADL